MQNAKLIQLIFACLTLAGELINVENKFEPTLIYSCKYEGLEFSQLVK